MINLKLASPLGVDVEKEVSQVEIKVVEGNIVILPNHIPFISKIENGYVKFDDNQIDIEEGVVHFNKNNMYITYFK